MKKHVPNLFAFALLFALADYSLANPLVPPVRTLEIPYAAPGSVTIDGVDDAGYSAEQSTDAFNPTGSTGADADFTFSFKVAYDLQYLYLWGNVLDDFDNSITYTTDANPWEYDNIEVFLNLDTVGSTTPPYDDNTIQLRFNRGLADSVQAHGRATQEEYQYHFENTAAGWLIETAIPWTCVLGSGQLPEDIIDYLSPVVNGFDMSGADSDTPGPGARDCQTAWDNDDPSDPADGTEDNAWNNRTVFGIMTLQSGVCCWPEENSNIPQMEQIPVYPNPAGNIIHFQLDKPGTVTIYTLTGVRLLEVQTTGEVDISDLRSGMYLAECNGSFINFIKE